jgi:hypothetical protein
MFDSVINLLNLTSVIRRTRVRKAPKRSAMPAVSGGQSCSANLKMEMTWPAAVSPRLRPGLHDFFFARYITMDFVKFCNCLYRWNFVHGFSLNNIQYRTHGLLVIQCDE